MSIRVVNGGMFTTVQDLGRTGYQRDGVPVSGAMDRFALRAANILVGNAPGDAALEVTLRGPALEMEAGALVAVAGATSEVSLDGEPVPLWHPVWVPRGSLLQFGTVYSGCRAYLAIAGGIDVPIVLGGRSTYVRGGFGGLGGRAIVAGDVIPVGALPGLSARIAASMAKDPALYVVASWGIGPSARPPYATQPVVRMLEGAHSSALTATGRQALFTQQFTVSPHSDRMGYRLLGTQLELTKPLDLLSEAVTFGTMQLPPSGQPIVLMADHQTTGGYPRIGEVASVDLPLMAQLRPGDSVRFVPVSLAEAQRLYLEREREMSRAQREILLRHS